MPAYSTYSGGWLRNAYSDPLNATVHTADPAHGNTDTTDERVRMASSAPPMTPVAPIGEYPGLEWVITTGGTSIDRTDYASHEARGPDEDPHGENLGAPRQGVYAVPPMRFADELYRSARFAGLPAPPISDTALRRGLNSLPENNPDGFLLGSVEQHWVDRRFHVGERVHEARVLTPNTAYWEVDAPAAPSSYTSPFSSLARMFGKQHPRPSIRREPPPIGDRIVSDDPLYPSVVPVWVVT